MTFLCEMSAKMTFYVKCASAAVMIGTLRVN